MSSSSADTQPDLGELEETTERVLANVPSSSGISEDVVGLAYLNECYSVARRQVEFDKKLLLR